MYIAPKHSAATQSDFMRAEDRTEYGRCEACGQVRNQAKMGGVARAMKLSPEVRKAIATAASRVAAFKRTEEAKKRREAKE